MYIQYDIPVNIFLKNESQVLVMVHICRDYINVGCINIIMWDVIIWFVIKDYGNLKLFVQG
jgi:hypothetical protein